MKSQELRKVRVGRVVSDKMDKTVVVAVERHQRHRLYGKSLRRVTKLIAHDAANQYHLGDTVRIIETRPLSKTKRWRVKEKIATKEVAQIALAKAADVEMKELDTEIRQQQEEVAAAALTLEAEAPAAETAETVPSVPETLETEVPAAEAGEPEERKES